MGLCTIYDISLITLWNFQTKQLLLHALPVCGQASTNEGSEGSGYHYPSKRIGLCTSPIYDHLPLWVSLITLWNFQTKHLLLHALPVSRQASTVCTDEGIEGSGYHYRLWTRGRKRKAKCYQTLSSCCMLTPDIGSTWSLPLSLPYILQSDKCGKQQALCFFSVLTSFLFSDTGQSFTTFKTN